MRLIITIVLVALLLAPSSPSFAIDQDLLKERIAIHLQKVTAGARIQEPSLKSIDTRSPSAGPQTDNGLFLVICDARLILA